MGDTSRVDEYSGNNKHIEEDEVEFIEDNCGVVLHRAYFLIFDTTLYEILDKFIDKKEYYVGENGIQDSVGRCQWVVLFIKFSVR